MPKGSRALTLAVVALLAFAAGFAVRGMIADEPAFEAPQAAAPSRGEHSATPRRSPTPRLTPPEIDSTVESVVMPPVVANWRMLSAHVQDEEPESAERCPVRVRGRCVDESGAPLRVDVRVPGGTAIATDADGRFELQGVNAATREVSFSPIAGRQAWQKAALRSAVDGVIEQGDIVLRAGPAIRGTFTDLDGRPLPHVAVNLHIADTGNSRTTTTDDAGRFVFENVGGGFVAVTGRSPSCRLVSGEHDAWVHLPHHDGGDVALKVLSAHYARIVYTDEKGGRLGLRSGSWRWFALDDASDAAEGSWTDSPPCDGLRIPVRVGATYEFRFETAGFLPVVQRFEAGEEYDRLVPVVLRPASR